MFCPKCSVEINSVETKFCSKCGFSIKAVRKTIETNNDENELTPFQKGLRLGVKFLLIAIILFPVFQILSGFFPPDDKFVESSPSSTWFDFLGNAILFALTLSGIARIFYAFVFDRDAKSNVSTEKLNKEIAAKEIKYLPPMQARPISDFGKWKTTDELFEPIFSKPKASGELNRIRKSASQKHFQKFIIVSGLKIFSPKHSIKSRFQSTKNQ